MRTFVTTFALPVFAAGLIYILTNQLPIQERYRVPVVLTLTFIALTAAWMVEEKKEAGESERRRSRIFVLVAVLVSVSGILLLSHFRNHQVEATIPSSKSGGNDSGQTIPNQEVPAPPTPQVPTGHATKYQSAQPNDGLIVSIDTTKRPRDSGPAWAVAMFSDGGGDFPILRAASQQALSLNGIATTSLIKVSAPIQVKSDLFTPTAATLETIKPYCDGLIMGKVSVAIAPSDQFSGMYATHLTADIKLISTSVGVRNEFVIEEDGGGFNADTSRSNAERRLAEKLKTELAQFSFQ